jgi:hypothetical protein
MIVICLAGIGIGFLWLVQDMDTIKAGDRVSYISKVTGTRLFGRVVRYFDHQYIVRLQAGLVTVPEREITKEDA